MPISNRGARLGIAFTAALCALPLAAHAAAETTPWPERPVTLVVPYPPGGTSDIVGRQLAEKLREALGQTFVVDNKAGAATAIGAAAVARAPKDGYTLLLSAGTTFTVVPHMYDKLQYSLADFAPVGTVCAVPFAFVVKNDLPVKSVQEYVAYAKAKPGAINNATNGQGSMVHLLGEAVADGLGVKLTQVHYKGASPAMMDIIGGVVDSNVEAVTNAAPNVKAGKYRALAVLSDRREALLPDVPTFKELGYPSIVGETWYAVFAPAGTPQPVVDKLGAALRKITDSADFRQAMERIGNESKTSTPAQLLDITREQSTRWGEMIQRLNLKM